MNVELLAPAGEKACITQAINFGADAVYLGGPDLQLRSNKVGFTLADLAEAAAQLHAAGKKMYVTVNAFARNGEMERLPDYARQLADMGADAVIVADPGVLVTVKAAAPDLDVHISTQANTTNFVTARTWHDMGASRVVLARELSLAEIAEIRAKTPKTLEFECFVHGAMCMAYSGRCMISSFLTGRSANRGGCTQPCRWHFSVMESKRPGEYFPLYEGEEGTAIFSSHDLCCIGFLDELERAGVSSFKIEGRMKSEYYVAATVDAYRHAMDGTRPLDRCRADLEAVSHRPYSAGFYYNAEKFDHNNDGTYHTGCTFVAEVLDWQAGMATLRQRNRFTVGETLEVLSPRSYGVTFPVESISDEVGEQQPAAPHPMQILRVPCKEQLYKGDLIRRREE